METDRDQVVMLLALYRAGDTIGSPVRSTREKGLDGPEFTHSAHREVRLRLQSVSAQQWALPTPCDGWSVRDLVQHMAVGATMSRQLLSGETWTREAVVEEVSSVPDLRAEWEWRTAEERLPDSWPLAAPPTVQ